MPVDGTTMIGGADSIANPLSDGLGSPGWGPLRFEAYQLRDYADLRVAYSDGTTVTTRPVLRLWSNQDAHLYGELVLHNGAVRSFNTMSLACVTNGEDVVSFRSGTSTGTQVARVTADGSYKIYSSGVAAALGPTALTLYSSGQQAAQLGTSALTLYNAGLASSSLSAAELRFYTDATIRGLSGSGTYRALTVEGSTLTLQALDGAALKTWATLSLDGSGARVLSYPPVLGVGYPLQLDTGKLRIRVHEAGGITYHTWGEFDYSSSTRRLLMKDDTVFEVNDGTNWQDFTLRACNITFQIKCTAGTVAITNSSGDTVQEWSAVGWGRWFSTSSNSAYLQLDSTRTTGAKKWELRSDTSDGNLKLINQTDTGTPTVRITPAGALYSPDFLGTKAVTGAPADGDGEVGAHVIDTTNKRIWVKVTTTGTNRWWYTNLTSPG